MDGIGARAPEQAGSTLGLAPPVELHRLGSRSAIMELAAAEIAYRIGIAATPRAIQPSLASFLR